MEVYLACGKLSQIRLHNALELFNKAGRHHRLCPGFDLLVPNISRVERNAKPLSSPAASALVPGRSGTPAKLAAYGTTCFAL
jgi:hypothetical protein